MKLRLWNSGLLDRVNKTVIAHRYGADASLVIMAQEQYNWTVIRMRYSFLFLWKSDIYILNLFYSYYWQGIYSYNDAKQSIEVSFYFIEMWVELIATLYTTDL